MTLSKILEKQGKIERPVISKVSDKQLRFAETEASLVGRTAAKEQNVQAIKLNFEKKKQQRNSKGFTHSKLRNILPLI